MGGVSPSFVTKRELRRRCSVLSSTLPVDDLAHKSRVFKKLITEDYAFSTKIAGTGFSGPVRVATHIKTKKLCAVKRYDKTSADPERIDFLKSEAQIYLLLDHPNICKLFAIYEDDHYVWIVMEYCAGLELAQRLHAKKLYSESDARQVTKQMVEAVHYLHSHHIVHRDLKLENWLYENLDEENLGRLKLIDFGFSKLWHPNRSRQMQASCGSLTYVSPDTLKGAYTNACDMWSLGVTVYFLLVGIPPFFGAEPVIIQRILRGAYYMDGVRWNAVSETGKDFVRYLLVVDPRQRMTSEQALHHPWLTPTLPVPQDPLPTSVLDSFREFAVASRFKRIALSLMAYSLTTKDIEDLTQMFERFDRNKDGCISLSDFMEVMNENFHISREEIKELFNAMRTIQWEEDSGNFELRYSAFIAVVLQTRLCYHEDAIREAFLNLDVDRSGFITTGDLRAAIGDTFEDADVEDILSAADADGDGRIDYDEFLTALFHEANPQPFLTQKSRASLGNATVTVETLQEEADGTPLKKPESQQSLFLRRLLRVVDRLLATGGSPSPRKFKASRSSPHISQLKSLYNTSTVGDPQSPHARPWDFRIHGAREFDQSEAVPILSIEPPPTISQPCPAFPYSFPPHQVDEREPLWLKSVELVPASFLNDVNIRYTPSVNDFGGQAKQGSDVSLVRPLPRRISAAMRYTRRDARVKPLDLSILKHKRNARCSSCPASSAADRHARFLDIFDYDAQQQQHQWLSSPKTPAKDVETHYFYGRSFSERRRRPANPERVKSRPTVRPTVPCALFNEHQLRP